MVAGDGYVKVLDFGLALGGARGPAATARPATTPGVAGHAALHVARAPRSGGRADAARLTGSASQSRRAGVEHAAHGAAATAFRRSAPRSWAEPDRSDRGADRRRRRASADADGTRRDGQDAARDPGGGELAARFEGGVAFVNLAPLADAALVASAVARALDVRESGRSAARESIAEHLRGRGPTLLFMDNFEQVSGGRRSCATSSTAARR